MSKRRKGLGDMLRQHSDREITTVEIQPGLNLIVENPEGTPLMKLPPDVYGPEPEKAQ